MLIFCSLCFERCSSEPFFSGKVHRRNRNFYKCENCGLIFVPENEQLSEAEEKAHYELHENTLENEEYVRRFDLIVELVEKFDRLTAVDKNSYMNPPLTVLDYGCGPSPILEKLLISSGVATVNYDKYFFPEEPGYKFQATCCTEVVEHFRNPFEDWKKLFSFLEEPTTFQQRRLWVMTEFADEKDFARWGYCREVTHVAFYQKKTFEFIAERFRKKLLFFEDNIVEFEC